MGFWPRYHLRDVLGHRRSIVFEWPYFGNVEQLHRLLQPELWLDMDHAERTIQQRIMALLQSNADQ
jgi:hypothetical protein